MKTSLYAAVALAIVASSEAVQGVSIQISLGAPGALSFDTKVPFNDLNGTALLGQSVSVDFMFTSSEFARLFTVTTDPLVLLTLQTKNSGSVGFLQGTGQLIDNLSKALEPPETLGSATSSAGTMIVGLSPQVKRPIDFYGVHYDLTFPNNPGVAVTEGEFRLFSDSGPFGIGPGVPADIVSDTGGTAILLGLGFFGMMLPFTQRLRSNTR